MTQEPFLHPPIRSGWSETASGCWSLSSPDGTSGSVGLVVRKEGGGFSAFSLQTMGNFETLKAAMIASEAGAPHWRLQVERANLARMEDADMLDDGLSQMVWMRRGSGGYTGPKTDPKN